MVMKKSYYSVGGEIIGEKSGGVRTDYLTDALGSVTATVDQNGSVINRYTYKPYGGLLAKTGVGADPSNQWVVSLAYRQTSKKYSDVYVRARHCDTNRGRWTTKDPIGFKGGGWNVYGYGANSPVRHVDAAGLSITIQGGDTCGKGVNRQIQGCCGALQSILNDVERKSKFTVDLRSCMKEIGYPGSLSSVDEAVQMYVAVCRANAPNVCIWCLGTKTTDPLPPGWPTKTAQGNCNNKCCNTGFDSYTYVAFDEGSESFMVPPIGDMDVDRMGQTPEECDELRTPAGKPRCDSVIAFCGSAFETANPTDACPLFFHELLHSANLDHRNVKGKNKEATRDWIWAMQCCMCCSIYGPEACSKNNACSQYSGKKPCG